MRPPKHLLPPKERTERVLVEAVLDMVVVNVP